MMAIWLRALTAGICMMAMGSVEAADRVPRPDAVDVVATPTVEVWRVEASVVLKALLARAGLTGTSVDHPSAMREFDQGRSELGFSVAGTFGMIQLSAAETPSAALLAARDAIGRHCAAPPSAVPEMTGAVGRLYLECQIESATRLFYLVAAPRDPAGQHVITLFGQAGTDDVAKARAIGDAIVSTAIPR